MHSGDADVNFIVFVGVNGVNGKHGKKKQKPRRVAGIFSSGGRARPAKPELEPASGEAG